MPLSIRIGCFILFFTKIILEIPTTNGSDIFEVCCELSALDEQPWLLIFQRKRPEYEYGRWQDYTQGYSTCSGNYFIGLSKLHAITSRQPHQLAAQLINAEGVQQYLHYDEFAINGGAHSFSIAQLGNYVGSMPLVQLKDWLPWHAHI